MKRFLAATAALVALLQFQSPIHAQSPQHTLQVSSEVLESIQSIPARSIPAALLADAQGIAIIPGVIKAGFIVGGRGGHGVVLSRNPDGTWGMPAFIGIGGASLGLQAGVQSTDVILVFKTRKSLERVVNGKGKLTLGADAAIAAGPIGRQAAVGTDGMLRAEIFSYSRSRGLFAGVSFDGAGIVYDHEANQEFMRNQTPPMLSWVDRLRNQIAQASDPKGPPPIQLLAPAPPPPPILPPRY